MYIPNEYPDETRGVFRLVRDGNSTKIHGTYLDYKQFVLSDMPVREFQPDSISKEVVKPTGRASIDAPEDTTFYTKDLLEPLENRGKHVNIKANIEKKQKEREFGDD